MAESPITTPDEGMELCYECDGKCICWHCEGTGIRNGKRCTTCGGRRTCLVCAGAGQLSAGSEAHADELSRTRIAVRVGRFRELGDKGTPFTLADARGKRSPEHTSKVVEYLRGGKLLTVSPELAHDVFDPSMVAGTNSTRTDGDFAWPDVLAYYVERYAVELLPMFEACMAGRGWVPPADVDITGLKPSS